MLEHLFGSRTRVKLLGVFLRRPEEPLFVREITRRIGTQINAVRRELANLVRLGLITETSVVSETGAEGKKQPGLKRKYYKVNREFRLLSEVTALMMKAQLLLERKLDREIAKLGDVRYMAFFGAFLGLPPAPVDLLLVGQVDKKLLKNLIDSVQDEFGFEINFSAMTMDDFKYRKDMMDKFLYAILEAPKSVVVDRLNERIAE
jgi:predicted transcriptional regulator